MSDDAEKRTYEVEVAATVYATVEVEAVDEDEAHDLAKDEARLLSRFDWDDVDTACIEIVEIRGDTKQ